MWLESAKKAGSRIPPPPPSLRLSLSTSSSTLLPSSLCPSLQPQILKSREYRLLETVFSCFTRPFLINYILHRWEGRKVIKHISVLIGCCFDWFCFDWLLPSKWQDHFCSEGQVVAFPKTSMLKVPNALGGWDSAWVKNRRDSGTAVLWW